MSAESTALRTALDAFLKGRSSAYIETLKKASTQKQIDQLRISFMKEFDAVTKGLSKQAKLGIYNSYVKSRDNAANIIKNGLTKGRVLKGSRKEAASEFATLAVGDIERSILAARQQFSSLFYKAQSNLRILKQIEDIPAKEAYGATVTKQFGILSDSVGQGIVNVGARRMRLSAYVDIVTDFQQREANNQAVLRAGEANGITRFRVSAHGSKDWCIYFENKVFSSRTDDPDGIPYVGQLPNGGPPFHFGCKHFLIPFMATPTSEEIAGLIADPAAVTDNVAGLKAKFTKDNGTKNNGQQLSID